MKILGTLFFFLLLIEGMYCQQLPIFTEYRQYYSFINPASSSSEFFDHRKKKTFIGLSVRQQNFGNSSSKLLDEIPKNIFFRLEIVLPRKSNLYDRFTFSLGCTILEHDINPIQYGGYYLSGKVKWKLSEDRDKIDFVSVGLNVGGLKHRLDISSLKPHHIDDPLLVNYSSNDIFFNLGFGVFYYKQLNNRLLARRRGKMKFRIDDKDERQSAKGDKFYIGISVPQIGQSLIYSNEVDEFKIWKKTHWYSIVGYRLEGAGKKEDWDNYWEATLWGKYIDGQPFHFDFNLRHVWKKDPNHFWFGGGLKLAWNTNVIHYGFGFSLKKITIGIGGDYYIKRIGNSHWSNEVNFAYSF